MLFRSLRTKSTLAPKEGLPISTSCHSAAGRTIPQLPTPVVPGGGRAPSPPAPLFQGQLGASGSREAWGCQTLVSAINETRVLPEVKRCGLGSLWPRFLHSMNRSYQTSSDRASGTSAGAVRGDPCQDAGTPRTDSVLAGWVSKTRPVLLLWARDPTHPAGTGTREGASLPDRGRQGFRGLRARLGGGARGEPRWAWGPRVLDFLK